MSATLRPMTREDMPEALELWNADYVHDQVSPRRFERALFGDRHYEEEGVLAAVEGGRIAGFVCCVAPDPGVGWLGPVAFLKAICAGTYGPGGPADELVAAAEKFAAKRGKEGIHVVEYAAGGFFFPGIDVRYEDKVEFFLRNGFERTGENQDVAVDLTDFTLNAWQQEAQERAAANGIRILPYDPSMLDMMRGLVAAINMGQWFREGWENRRKSRTNTFVAIRADKMLGYADYRPGEERGSFGTTAVLPELRGQGIGTCLLVASMLKMKELGTPRVAAGWANTPFYLKNGWHVYRRYATLHKDLKG